MKLIINDPRFFRIEASLDCLSNERKPNMPKVMQAIECVDGTKCIFESKTPSSTIYASASCYGEDIIECIEGFTKTAHIPFITAIAEDEAKTSCVLVNNTEEDRLSAPVILLNDGSAIIVGEPNLMVQSFYQGEHRVYGIFERQQIKDALDYCAYLDVDHSLVERPESEQFEPMPQPIEAYYYLDQTVERLDKIEKSIKRFYKV